MDLDTQVSALISRCFCYVLVLFVLSVKIKVRAVLRLHLPRKLVICNCYLKSSL